MPKRKPTRGRWVPPAQNTLQLKLVLQHTRPPIWRRLVVPDNATLGDLHGIIQTAMGWFDCHLHAFRIGDVTYGMKSEEFASDDLDEDTMMLGRILTAKGQKFTYEYDFGDGWIHTVAVEKVLPATEPHPRVVCLAGARACPPEDCGGPWGFQRALEVLQGTEGDDDAEILEWLGDYDPGQFDLERVNRMLA